MSELAADGIPVAVSLRVLKLSRQPYYRWRHQQVTTAELTEAYRANALLDAHVDDPEYGYRFLVGEAAEAGEAMCERTAWWICRDNQWWSVFGKKRGKNGKRPGPPVHDDLVKRDFSADDVNELWLTDITEHWTDEGKLYLCAIKDVFSGRIVGYSIADRMKARLAVNALDNAMSRRRDAAGCIVHSDRGSQGGFNRWLQHRYFQSILAARQRLRLGFSNRGLSVADCSASKRQPRALGLPTSTGLCLSGSIAAALRLCFHSSVSATANADPRRTLSCRYRPRTEHGLIAPCPGPT